MLWTSLQVFTGMLRQRLMFQPRLAPAVVPQLAGIPYQQSPSTASEGENTWIWFAVPKRKHTKSRKRMKTTAQKRLPVKKNIIFDPRTGEVTLQHKLPFNWKDYLPKID